MVRCFATGRRYVPGLTSLARDRSRDRILDVRDARRVPAPRGSEGGMRNGCDLGARHRAVAASLRFRVAAAAALAPRLPLRDSSGRGVPVRHIDEEVSRCRTTRSSTSSTKGSSRTVIRPIKSGKEASVHLVRANPRTTGETLAALKVFHPSGSPCVPGRRAVPGRRVHQGASDPRRRGEANRVRQGGRRGRSGSIASGRC